MGISVKQCAFQDRNFWIEEREPIIEDISAEPPSYLHRWVTREVDVRVLPADPGPMLEVRDLILKEVPLKKTILKSSDLDQALFCLRRSHITYNEGKWLPCPVEILQVWPLEGYPHYELSLCKRDKSSFWHLVNTNTKTASWAPINTQWRPGNYGSKGFFAHLPKSNEESQTYIQDYHFHIEIENERLKNIGIELRKFASLSPYVAIDRDHWGVTLISAGRSSGIQMPCDNGHAMIAIDQVVKGVSQRTFVHLTVNPDEPFHELKEGEAQLEVLENREVNIRNQTETWIRSAHLVKGFLNDMRESGREAPFAFHILADSSFNPTAIKLLGRIIFWGIKETAIQFWHKFILRREDWLAHTRESSKELDQELGGIPNPYNCLSLCKEVLPDMGIYLPKVAGNSHLPDFYIKAMNEFSSAYVMEESLLYRLRS